MLVGILSGCTLITDFSDAEGDGSINSNANDNGNNTSATCGDYVVQPPNEECDDGNQEEWDGCWACRIAEQQVNTAWPSNQEYPAVACASDGRCVVAWESDVSSRHVLGRLFHADGTPNGGEIALDSSYADASSSPSVAMADDGSFVAVWGARVDTDWSVLVRRFDAAGTALGDHTVLETVAPHAYEPAIAMAPDGEHVVIWADGYGPMRGTRLSAMGEVLTSDFAVSDALALWQQGLSVDMSADHYFVAAWTGSDDADDVHVRLFNDADVSVTVDLIANATTGGAQHHPAVALSEDHRFFVAWTSDAQDDSLDAVVGQRFDALGAPEGGEIQLNINTLGDQNLAAVATNGTGAYYVAWTDSHGDMQEGAIVGRWLDATGTLSAEEYLINEYQPHSQLSPQLAYGNETFVAVWQSWHQDGSYTGIFLRRNPPGAPP